MRIKGLEKKESGFFRLISDPRVKESKDLHDMREGTLESVAQYLATIRAGDNEGPYCPFMKALEKRNGIFVIPVSGKPILKNALDMLEEELNQIPNYENPPTFSTAIALFKDSEMMSNEAFENLESFRKEYRSYCLAKGLTLAIAHPRHPIGGNSDGTRSERFDNAPLFISDFPLLLLRKTHRSDAVFMHDDDAERLFKKGLNEV